MQKSKSFKIRDDFQQNYSRIITKTHLITITLKKRNILTSFVKMISKSKADIHFVQFRISKTTDAGIKFGLYASLSTYIFRQEQIKYK